MSRMRAALAGFVISTAVPALAGAQEMSDLLRRLDSATKLAADARHKLSEYERQHPVPAATWDDSVAIVGGRITVYFNADVSTIAKPAALRADSILRQIGSATSKLLPLRFSVRRDTTAGAMRSLSIIVGYLPAGGGSINGAAPPDPRVVAKTIVDQTVDFIIGRGMSPVLAWRLGPVPLDPHDIASETDWRLVRLELVSSPSLLGKKCYDGDLDACTMYLGLRDVSDPVMAWYDSAARHDRVESSRDLAERFQRSATAHCLAGSDVDCATALRAMSRYVTPPGLAPARVSLMQNAVALGGDRAAERLLTSGGNPSEALAATAKMPIDSLVRAWQRDVQTQATSSRDATPRLALVAIGWIVLLAVLALRSSRWR